MSQFFSPDIHPASESTKMSLGECYNRIKEGELDVPDYQREYVWTTKQQQDYLGSLSLNLPLFGPVINIDTDTGDQWVMDGQNRLWTIYYFMNDEISFVNHDKATIKFSELTDSEQRRLKNIKISYTETRDWSRSQCQEFFMVIQGGEKLKYGELIHAKPENPLTKAIIRILELFNDLFINPVKDGGIGLSKGVIKRFGHYEIIGTIINMVRLTKYPLRPGKTALKEFERWSDETKSILDQRALCIENSMILLERYSLMIKNVARLKEGVKKEEHLRLMYFLYKTGLYKSDPSDQFLRIDNLLNTVLNKDNHEYHQIITWGTGGAENIYDLYLKIYNE